ncbi:unnamed protein product [Gadus morhua 'NCC']|uniref:RRM domain-containing protein n=1 Tax=Gadus morhua TaxID=8049 RepID=A0A8C5BN24_GADMO
MFEDMIQTGSTPPLAPIHGPAPLSIMVFPNRLFVGRVDCRTTEEDIWRFFSRHGAVKEVNIVFNHMGLSKGYGFVTFDSQVDARRLLEMAPSLLFQGRHLLVAPAVRRLSRRQRSGCEADRAQCVLHLTTPSGHPYTFCNGVAYFRRPEPAPPAHYGPLVVAPHGHYGPTAAPPAHYGPTAAPHGHFGPPI